MLNIATENSILIEFLSKYPESLRQSCAEAVMLYGIRTLKSKFPYGLTAPQLLSVSGLTLPMSASVNVSNRSMEVSQLNPISRTDEKTERFPQTRWASSHNKPFTRLVSEKEFKVSPGLKEPQTASFDMAKNLLDKKNDEVFDRENEVMKIADNFLKNSYAAYLSNGFRG